VSKRTRQFLRLLGTATICGAIAACGSDKVSAPATGSLTVSVTTPTGVTPSVMVTGPGSYSQAVTATTTLTGLKPGSYTIAAASVSPANTVVTTTYAGVVTGSPATVAANQTATASVNYTANVGGLWVANNNSATFLVDFTATQLDTSGTPTPVESITGTSPDGDGVSMAFDRSGNLWVQNGGTNTILEYAAAQLDSASPTPVISLTDTAFNSMYGVAFDTGGNLWIANYGPCEILKYSAAQLAGMSGAVSMDPAYKLNSCGAIDGDSLTGPQGLAFDASGNLWVTDVDHDEVYVYVDSQLVGTGYAVHAPTLIIRVPSNNMGYPAFDATGNLWFTNNGASVYEYTTTQLASIGRVNLTPTINTQITAAALNGIAYDNSGNLWLSDANANAVYQLTAAQLTSTTVTPTVTIGASSGSLVAPYALAFLPHSSSLPLFSKRPRIAGRLKK
jgi:streptogramin lyase